MCKLIEIVQSLSIAIVNDQNELIDWILVQYYWNFIHSKRTEVPKRQQSLDDINLDQFLKIANYEDTVKELDVYYGIGM